MRTLYGAVLVEDAVTVDGRVVKDTILPDEEMPVKFRDGFAVVGKCTKIQRDGGIVSVEVVVDDDVEGDLYITATIGKTGKVEQSPEGYIMITGATLVELTLDTTEVGLWPGVTHRLVTIDDVTQAFNRVIERQKLLTEFMLNVDNAAENDDMEGVKMALDLLALSLGNLEPEPEDYDEEEDVQ